LGMHPIKFFNLVEFKIK